MIANLGHGNGVRMRNMGWLALLCGLSGNAGAADAPASDRTVRIGLQSVIAPFAMPEQQTGLFVDVLRAAFLSQQMRTEFLYVPNVRFEHVLRDGTADISTAAKPGFAHNGFLSRWPVTYFRNMAITVRSRVPVLNSLADLKQWRVTAFRDARKLLGPAYSAAMAQNPHYREARTMPSGALFLGRTDVIVSQRDIFLYYLSTQLAGARGREGELAYHDVIGPGNLYWMAFRTEAQRESFERGMADIYATGEIDRIIERYRRDYGTSRDFILPLDCHFRPTQDPKACKELARRQ